ncbi:hypothetical protein D9615_009792 [Tricholomella constricta]|uniref:F-box domain-containing protein n=1 Tax=Tricholomella constricta TaxID=117010 RepID=A0A8H5LVE6_9AGAR|nr:hypothetical protein D9615_009792 [Tricholomella constricta]
MSLPPELYLLAFAHLPPSSLAAISLCSRLFRIWAFPLLYNRVFLMNNEQASAFASRVTDQELGEPTQRIIDGLRFAEHVKCLYVGHDDMSVLNETLQLLILAIPSLKQLQGLVWKPWLDYWDGATFLSHAFASIRDNCDNFDSLSILIHRDGGFDEFMDFRLDFRGRLKHLQIQTDDISLWDDEIICIMAKVARFSPDLETLDLSLHGNLSPEAVWDVDEFCKSLDGIRYSRLQCLKLCDAAYVDLASLGDISSHPSPFRSFLELNHHNITILSLPPPTRPFDSFPDDLHLPADIFPNLREFEGTIYWCHQISKLRYPASQLRTMNILMERPIYEEINNYNNYGYYDEEKALEMVYSALRSCSALTELVLCDDFPVTGDILRTLSECAPGLQTLTCFLDLTEAVEPIIPALPCFKRLRRFTTNKHILLMDHIMSSGREQPLLLDDISRVNVEEDHWW